MDDDNNLDRSESTEENEERSETETEGFDKPDSDIVSQSGGFQESTCRECSISFQSYDEFQNHVIQKHPIPMYKCVVGNCLRWFSKRKNRDKHSENLNSRLHNSTCVKTPPPNAIFIEDASQDQLEIFRNFTNDYNRTKVKRGPKPKLTCNDNDKYFLVGLPRDQLKRKLMESVVEKIESIPNKKTNQDSTSLLLTKHSKMRSSLVQLSQSPAINILNVSNPKQLSNKGNYHKNVENTNNFPTITPFQKFNPIPDLSHIKVPILPLDNIFSIEKFSEDLINLLVIYDPAEYFKYPLVDHFAPFSFQLTDQIDMQIIKRKLTKGYYLNNLENLENDLLLLYSNGIHCFNEKSVGWNEAAKLFQTTLVNIHGAKKKLECNSKNVTVKNCSTKSHVLNNSKINSNDRSIFLNILNPYNNGKINENERIITIGDQIGKLKCGSQNLLGYKEDRRNKVTVLSYLDYGSNFSFGPSYDSGNAYCSKETSDLLIRAYGDNNYLEEFQCEELNEIIPEVTLGDDFSLYLMNTLTRDIIKSFRSEEEKIINQSVPGEEINLLIEDNEKKKEFSNLQGLLNDNWKDLIKLKTFNYQRLSNYELQPSNDEQNLSEKVTANLTNLILKTNPESVTNLKVIRKALNCV